MAKRIINNGAFDNDPSAEKIRDSFTKVNENFTELYDTKQNILVSGTNIKTINGSTILGSDDILLLTKKQIITNVSVSGTYNLDPSVADTYNLTLTGNTVLGYINFSTEYAQPLTAYITGNFAITYPIGSTVIGTYSTTKKNQLVVERVGASIYITINNYV